MYKLLVLICALFVAGHAQAEEADFGLDETLDAIETPAAQITKTDEVENKKQTSELVKELNLTPEQKEKAKRISETSRIEMEHLQEDMKKILQKARNLEEQSLNEFAEVLTDEQKAKFYEYKSLRSEELKAHDAEIDDVMAPFNE